RKLKSQQLAKLSAGSVPPDMLETRPVPNSSAPIVEDTVLLPRFFSRPPQRTCPRCHTRLDEHASFCKNCGARLDKSDTSELAAVRLYKGESQATQSLSQVLPCPQCGKALPPHAKFCSACGQHIEQGGKEKWSVAALVTAIITVVLPIVAFAIWAFSLEAVHINLRNMNNLGLISIFPPSLIVALLIIAASFGLAISQKRLSIPILLFHILLLIFVLYGVTALVESIPRFAVVYRHAGYTDYIMRHGSVDPNLDAYFNWPGFFIFVAFMTKIMGYNSILPYATWAPIFNNLLYVGPLYMLGRTFTNDKRIVWLSLFFFFVTNWIAQDYFSPQGFNFFLYLVMIVILVKWFKAPIPEKPRKLSRRWRILGPLLPLVQYFFSWLTAPDTLPNAPASKKQRVLLMGTLIAIFGLMVFTHPLTPFLTIAPVTALIVLRRNNPIWLPVAMIVMTAAWLYFMAQPYLAGNISALVGDFTHVSSTVTQNVTGRVTQGDPQHNFISDVRLLMTVFVWVLALIGGLMRLRKGYRDVTYVILALAPFPVFLAQSYGGEMLLRIYLFTLPPMCLFAASIFFTPTNRFVAAFMKVTVIILCVFLMGAFLYTRYG
ncbi:MAG TPA: zinc ribbon domain-containing protein, partial [Ktedonobacteraceae bacterium]|nr:zinc ribbon domain-containing protein [Ktedonobacteraceae bacterium]